MNSQNQILINIIAEGEEHLISTYRNEYRSLMVLIQEKFWWDGFGECGGMGRCATCLVKLYQVNEISDMDRNEAATLSKQGITDSSIRLGCQLLVEESLHGSTVVIVDS